MDKILFPKHKKAKILIIDDELDLCEFLKSILEKTGKFEVFTSMDPIEGIALAKQEHPSLIILDIVMPQMDGTEVVEYLQKDKSTKDIIIVFTSVLADTKDIEAGDGLIGGRPFIPKPIKKEELIARIETLLSDKSAAAK